MYLDDALLNVLDGRRRLDASPLGFTRRFLDLGILRGQLGRGFMRDVFDPAILAGDLLGRVAQLSLELRRRFAELAFERLILAQEMDRGLVEFVEALLHPAGPRHELLEDDVILGSEIPVYRWTRWRFETGQRLRQ